MGQVCNYMQSLCGNTMIIWKWFLSAYTEIHTNYLPLEFRQILIDLKQKWWNSATHGYKVAARLRITCKFTLPVGN